MDIWHIILIVVGFGLLFYVMWWGLAQIALPEPWNKIGVVLIVLLTIFVILKYLMPAMGVSTGI